MAEIRKYRPGSSGPVAEALARAFGSGVQPRAAAAPPDPGGEETDDDHAPQRSAPEGLRHVDDGRPVRRPGRVDPVYDDWDFDADHDDEVVLEAPPMLATLPMSVGWEAFVVPAPKRANLDG